MDKQPKCPRCSAELEAGAAFCGRCGFRLAQPIEEQPAAKQQSEADGFESKGQSAEAAGDKQEAAKCFFEAGWRFNLEGSQQRAAEILRRSIKLRPNFAPAYWYLMEALRLDSYQNKKPWVNTSKLEESLRVWNSRPAEPDTDYLWAYSSRALLSDLASRLPNQERWPLIWEGIAYFESALVLDSTNTFALASLSRLYRIVNGHVNALWLTQRATELAPEDPTCLEQHAITLAESGLLTKALEVIEKRRALGPSELIEMVTAYILLRTGRADEAVPLLNKSLENTPDESNAMWYRLTRAYCYMELTKEEQAYLDLEWLRSQYDAADVGNLDTYAWAFYKLGDLKSAVEIFRTLTRDPPSASSAHLFLALCYAEDGRFEEARAAIMAGLELANRPWALEDFARMELLHAEEVAAREPKREQLCEILAEFRRAIEEQQARMKSQTVSPELDLRRALGEAEENETVRAGILAGLGRAYFSQKQWFQAAETYSLLAPLKQHFPVVSIAFKRALNELQSEGVKLLQNNEYAVAIEKHFQPGCDLAARAGEQDKAAELAIQTGYTNFALERFADARQWFERGLARDDKAASEENGTRMGETCRALIPDPTAYWKLHDFWTVSEHSDVPVEIRKALEAARRALESFLGIWYRMTPEAGEKSAKPTPIDLVSLEANINLFPAGVETSKWVVIQSYLPAMRDRLRAATGILVPGVMMRDGPGLGDAAYRVVVKGVERARGEVVTQDAVFCSASRYELLEIGITDVIAQVRQPWDGQPGCWLSRSHFDAVKERRLTFYEDRWLYIIRHLESVLSWYRAAFLGREEVERLLDSWSKSGGEALLQRAFKDNEERQRFCRVLRALASEFVPLTNWKAILEATRDAGLAANEISPAVRAIRTRIKDELPGNGPDVRREWIPEDLEAHLMEGISHDKESRVYYSLAWQDATSTLERIDKFFQATGVEVALVTRDSDVRAFLQRLIKLAFPAARVLSREELLSTNAANFSADNWLAKVEPVRAAS